MLDDIREWISDNLRYILLGLAVLLVLIILFCVIRLASGGSKKKADTAPPAQQQEVVKDETVTEAEQAEPAGSSTAAASSDLVKDDAAVLTLVKDYYTAAAAKDVGTLSQIVSPWNEDVQKIILQNDVIESYNNLSTYSKKGLDNGSYVVYTYFEGKVANIDTLVPSLSRLYLITNTNGKLVVSADSDSDTQIADYINTVSADADVQALISDVNRQYQAALDSDAALKEYVNTLDTGSSSGSDTSEGSETQTESREMTATAGLNIRQEPSTEAAIIGSVISGTNVTVLEEVADGWCRINYATTQGTVEGYVKLQYLTEPAA